MSEKKPTAGSGPAKALLGLMGAVLVAGGMMIIYFAVTKWFFAFLSAIPGVIVIGYGASLLFACYYDDAIIERGPFGFPIVTGRESQRQGTDGS